MHINEAGGPFARLTDRIPHEYRAIAEEATILALIVVAATSAEGLAAMLLGEHMSPIIGGLLTVSLWVMCGIYAISVLSTMRKLVSERLFAKKGSGLTLLPRRGQTNMVSGNRRATDRPLSVLVVDDDTLASTAVKQVLSLDPRIGSVTTAQSPDAAVAKIQSGPENEAPDVVLLDVNYAGLEKTGIDALAGLHEISPRSKLVVMSVCREPKTIRAAVANEADGFIWKNESAVDFAEAVIGAARHSFVASKSAARDLLSAV